MLIYSYYIQFGYIGLIVNLLRVYWSKPKKRRLILRRKPTFPKQDVGMVTEILSYKFH